MDSNIARTTEQVKEQSARLEAVFSAVETVIVGQRGMLDRLMIGLLADGHVLIEGVPGLAKTTAVKTLAACLDTSFARIQFTPDLLPADLIGTQVFQPKTGEFTVRKGPIFNNIVLADEINRAPAKVQSALLEAMQERQVTIGNETSKLGEPFLVLATQNPIEQEGTYPLPEAQVDRFMLKLRVTYPTKREEKEILQRFGGAPLAVPTPVLNPAQILELRALVREIYLDEKIQDYILDLVFATREPRNYKLDLDRFITYGASPRASIYLSLAAKAQAFLKGRGYVTPQDVKSIARDVLRHRLVLSYEAEAEELTSDDLIGRILDTVEVP
ncbi:MAG: ATPase [Deltaproteobacteria bacterium RIFOXYA12_FULL_61_11]|nr:MAG: ATPase [Deltaproteobacteria bacterium RIFOXYA12_FULL_61_11]